jgi:hypothetical protein
MRFFPFLFLMPLLGQLSIAVGQTNFSLAIGFGNGMVLQRGAATVIQGLGPPGKKLLVRFKNEKTGDWVEPEFTNQVNAAGGWRVTLDLSEKEFKEPGARWTVLVTENQWRKRLKVEATNVLLGDVLLLAGWDGQGLRADQDDYSTEVQFFHDREAVRFLDLTEADLSGKPGVQPPAWVPWPASREESRRYSTLTLRLAHKLAAANYPSLSQSGYAGVVLLSRDAVFRGMDKNRVEQHISIIPAGGDNWRWVVAGIQSNRNDLLVYNKRHNLVENIPPVYDYDNANICSVEGFDRHKPPLSLFTFSAAIYSSEP